ncbi:MAG: multidrug efflux SMR transporter [Solirubrobacteraceae bacterium]|nr:multidrug efflux SMR transporter [Solirubrobacteraceae bacterium]
MPAGTAYLAAAILCEVVATVFLKSSEGLTRPGPSVVVVVGYVVSLALLAQALKSIDVGVAYAIWAGVGTAAITIIGILAFSEVLTAARAIGVGCIIVGVVALNLSGTHSTG